MIDAKHPLPAGWRWVRLGDVCEEWTGTRDPSAHADSPFIYVDITSVDNVAKRIIEPKKLSGKNAPSRARQIIQAGDVIISTTRPNLNAVAIVPDELDGQICSTGFCVLRAKTELDRDYLFAFVQSTDFVQTLSDLVRGALYPAVTDSQVRDQWIPLPPLPVQRRIAAILNEQMAAVERARTAAEAQLAAARGLPAAYLREVFEGAEAKRWPKKRFGEVAASVQNGIYKTAENYGQGQPFLRMYNLQNTSWNLVLEPMASVLLQGKENEAFRLSTGDLLISRVNSFELVGKCAWVGPVAEGYVYENMLIRVRVEQSVDSLFVAQQMNGRPVREQIQLLAKRAIGQASINAQDLRSVVIVLPSLDMQRTIARSLDSQREAWTKVGQTLQNQLDAINHLPAALLRRAFSGGL
jgi:type I restriction enzyme, S subunit